MKWFIPSPCQYNQLGYKYCNSFFTTLCAVCLPSPKLLCRYYPYLLAPEFRFLMEELINLVSPLNVCNYTIAICYNVVGNLVTHLCVLYIINKLLFDKIIAKKHFHEIGLLINDLSCIHFSLYTFVYSRYIRFCNQCCHHVKLLISEHE
jgi:hypothetical protein